MSSTRLTRAAAALAGGVAAAGLVGPLALAAAPAAAGAAPISPSTAQASPLGSSGEEIPPFYQAPDTLPGQNGAVIRSEPMSYLLDPAGVSQVAFSSTRMLYRSTDRTGDPIAVSGSVLVPKTPWVGPGKRPVIGYAVGTQGVGDSCAPSRQSSEGFEYESIFMSGLLARGYALAVTDYEGLGTAGMHTYMDRLSQGHTVLDAVRAAQRLGAGGLTEENPVGLVGYSQGGGAAASAAELAASYAPELAVKGSVVGAVPADLSPLPEHLDGGVWAEFLWFSILGLAASYDLDTDPYLNEKGRAAMAEVSDDCVFDLGNSALKKSSDYTSDGRSLAQLAEEEPFRSILDDQRIGRTAPSAPVLVTHSRLDDTIPYQIGAQLTRDWCDAGATVRLDTNAAPLHLGGMIPHSAEVYGYLAARFAGVPARSGC